MFLLVLLMMLLIMLSLLLLLLSTLLVVLYFLLLYTSFIHVTFFHGRIQPIFLQERKETHNKSRKPKEVCICLSL